MDIPGLGRVTKDAEFGWYCSKKLPVPVLGGKMCRILVDHYDGDRNQADYHRAIANFLSADASVLKKAEKHIFRYYEDCNSDLDPDEEGYLVIESPRDVWRHIRLGDKPRVKRRSYGDKGVYVSLECGCAWEHEHGLQIVLKNGLRVNKVGPYDGHLTNSDAYANDKLERVVYRARG